VSFLRAEPQRNGFILVFFVAFVVKKARVLSGSAPSRNKEKHYE
jgi:hypothetical protein